MMKVGHSLHVLSILTAVVFFLKESKNKPAFQELVLEKT